MAWPSPARSRRLPLARINRQGKHFELAGDYFMSGDLAFQLQEIIRATRELLKKTQRTRT